MDYKVIVNGGKKEEPEIKRGRGRPKGILRPPGLATKYPISWKPVYDQMIMLYLQGKTHKEIGLELNYTPVQVGNVIRSPQGRAIIEEISKGIQDFTKESAKSIGERVGRIKEKALDKMESFVDDKVIAEITPLKFIDRVIRIAGVVDGGGKGVSGVVNNTNITQNVENKTLVITSDAVSKLTDALNRSNSLALPTRDKEIRQRGDENGK